MRKFPKTINPDNKTNFKNIYIYRLKRYLRRDLFEHILSHDETDYFSFDEFFLRGKVLEKNILEKVIDEVLEELKKLEWNYKKSFGGTGVFIYSTDIPPANCWSED